MKNTSTQLIIFKRIILCSLIFVCFTQCSKKINPIIETTPPEIFQQIKTEQLENGSIYEITTDKDSYPFDHADYSLFIPKNVSSIRGILIHQHGCTMECMGITIPYDIQYQAFAEKWGFAILEPVLYGDCGKWIDPEAGSAQALHKALSKFEELSGHPEIETVPWLLWGHSGGGYWVLKMMKNYPERILGVFSYSPAFNPQWDFPQEAAKIPLFIRHAGENDFNDAGCWATALNVFSKLRKMGTPVSIAYNKEQNHNFSYCRYMAIPFYEAILKQRLSDNELINDLDPSKSWLANTTTLQLYKADSYGGNTDDLCLLPDSLTAANWKEFVSKGYVSDKTPPPSPYNLLITTGSEYIKLTWDADADIESGIKYFNIYVNGEINQRFPKTDIFQTFDTNGDNAIPKFIPEKKCFIKIGINEKKNISVSTVNNFGLESEKTKIIYEP